jgi:hypothetical protein
MMLMEARMRMPLVAVVTMVSVAATAPVAVAQTPAPLAAAGASQATRGAVVNIPSRDLFRELFLPVQKPMPQAAELPAPVIELPVIMRATKPTTACGMTLIGGDPKLDPTLPHPTPERASQGAIRAIPADGCGK